MIPVSDVLTFPVLLYFFVSQEEGVRPRRSSTRRHGNRIPHPARAQALHHAESRPTGLQHVQVKTRRKETPAAAHSRSTLLHDRHRSEGAGALWSRLSVSAVSVYTPSSETNQTRHTECKIHHFTRGLKAPLRINKVHLILS